MNELFRNKIDSLIELLYNYKVIKNAWKFHLWKTFFVQKEQKVKIQKINKKAYNIEETQKYIVQNAIKKGGKT